MNTRKKIVVITGAGRGLGKALAFEFAGPNTALAICSKHITRIMAVKKQLTDNGVECFATAFDAADEKRVNNFLKTVFKKYGSVDILINNAGYAGAPKEISSTSADTLKKHTEINLYSAFYFIRGVLPSMKKRDSGLIINIASGAGRKAIPGLGPYAISKFGLRALGETVAKETAGTNIKCFTVSPGGINTDMRKKLFGKKNARTQQSAETVAKIIHNVVDRARSFPNGADIHIRNGAIEKTYRPE